MKRGPISTGTATISAIGMAAVLTLVVAGVLLVPGEGAPDAGPARSLSALPVEVVAGYGDGGSADAPVLRISGTGSAINLTTCRVYLIDPKGALHEVNAAILKNATLGEGMAAYIFYFPADDRPAASGYWITDEPGMVFSAAYHPGVHPFSPGGQWRIVVYDQGSMKNRVDQVLLITGPASPA
jgi:hypothetical protein